MYHLMNIYLHRVVFWDLQSVPAAHAVAWMLSFVSFFFLYPTVFNLKEVAAVEKPQVDKRAFRNSVLCTLIIFGSVIFFALLAYHTIFVVVSP